MDINTTNKNKKGETKMNTKNTTTNTKQRRDGRAFRDINNLKFHIFNWEGERYITLPDYVESRDIQTYSNRTSLKTSVVGRIKKTFGEENYLTFKNDTVPVEELIKANKDNKFATMKLPIRLSLINVKIIKELNRYFPVRRMQSAREAEEKLFTDLKAMDYYESKQAVSEPVNVSKKNVQAPENSSLQGEQQRLIHHMEEAERKLDQEINELFDYISNREKEKEELRQSIDTLKKLKLTDVRLSDELLNTIKQAEKGGHGNKKELVGA